MDQHITAAIFSNIRNQGLVLQGYVECAMCSRSPSGLLCSPSAHHSIASCPSLWLVDKVNTSYLPLEVLSSVRTENLLFIFLQILDVPKIVACTL